MSGLIYRHRPIYDFAIFSSALGVNGSAGRDAIAVHVRNAFELFRRGV